jgi:hypothetical protein
MFVGRDNDGKPYASQERLDTLEVGGKKEG